MKTALSGLILAVVLSACAMPPSTPQMSPTLVRALDSAPDGYRAVTSTGQRFTIVSTAASNDRLCRVVSMEQSDTFAVDSYCKSRGGTWR